VKIIIIFNININTIIINVPDSYYDKVMMITFLLKYKRQTTDSLKAGNSPFISVT